MEKQISQKLKLQVNETFRDWKREDAPLFLQPQYFQLYLPKVKEAFSYQIMDGGNRVFLCGYFYDLGDGHWESPRFGTFGGPFIDEANLTFEEIFLSIEAIIEFLDSKKPVRTHISLPPLGLYPEATSIAFQILQHFGFKVSRCELNYHLHVDRCETLPELMNRNHKRNVRDTESEGFTAIRLQPHQLPEAYSIIADNRNRKGFPLTMKLEDIQNLQNVFPERLFCFAISLKESLIASAICIRIDAKVLYVFYWGELDGYSHPSPIPLLAKSIHHFSKQNGYLILNLGTSTVNGEPNMGLIQFKRSLGFSESLKFYLEKSDHAS